MVDRVEESGFWLPSEFLDDLFTDEQIIADKSKRNPLGTDLCFPREFPYANNVGEKSWVMSTSPQSTLTRLSSFSGLGSGNGSPNGVTSPPTTPSTHAVEDLIHRAAGQVARLKLSGGVDQSCIIYPKPKVGQPKDVHQHVDAERYGGAWYGHRQQQVGQDRKNIEHLSLSNPTRIPGTVFVGRPNCGGAGKKARAGTGVFLPRSYDNVVYPSDSRRKSGHASEFDLAYVSSVYKPSHHHMANMMMNHYNVSVESQPPPSYYEMLMARRNALMLQHEEQKRSMMLMEDSSLISRGIFLPHEWTY